MKQRVYIAGGEPAVLAYNSKELSFNGETLTFWVKGLTHFDVNAFVFSENEMSDASITLDLILPSSTTPEFDRFWYVEFRGEKFYLSTLKPTCVKNTESLQYTYTLIFKSQRSDLERYEFANFVSASSVPQVVSYDFTLPLTVQEFVERMNINLDYYFGSGVWQMILDPSCLDEYGKVVYNINHAIYDGTSRVTVSFSRQSLWSILTGIYDVFGLRWKISQEDGIMTIRLGYTPITLSHTFAYGKDNGLTAIERLNQQTPIFTRLSGMGSSRNLPYRYFKPEGSGYNADPDNNNFTENIPYSGLKTASYRLYVKGWNDKKAGLSKQSSLYAYEIGYNDAAAGDVFNPIDYVISESAELLYGIRKGSVADNDTIYPTLQQLTTNLNEIVAVEDVLNDDYNKTDASLNQVVANAVEHCHYQGSRTFKNTWTLKTAEFETLPDYNKISFYVTLDVSSNADSAFTYSYDCSVQLVQLGVVIDEVSFSVVNASTYYESNLVEFKDLDASIYSIRASARFSQNSGSRVLCTHTIGQVVRQPKNTYKDTFDIWIRNVWDTTFRDSAHPNETKEEYMHRVWDGLIAPNQDITVMFSDGALAGEDYEFKIARPADTTDYFIYYDPSVGDSHWRLSLLKSDANMESTKLPLPNKTINAEAGDKFFFINIEMPYDPYVYDAEQRLEDFLENELLKVSNENPTYSITPSSVFLEEYTDNASIGTGAQIQLSDEKILGVGVYPLSITNVTIEYTSDAMLPKWSITVAEKPTSTKNTIQIIQGDIKVLSSNLLSSQEMTERVQLALDDRYLQKNGTEQTSLSKTTFKDNVTLGGRLQSEEYLQGQLGGYGFSITKDALGSYVLEIDKINVRKSLNINELVVNQVSIYGGIHVYSAAAMTVSSVDSSNAAYHVCYMDIKNGTVLNQFVAGDHAYCQRFEPESGQLLKYYWKEVVAVGSDYIAISKTGGDGSINQIPAIGDNIAQLGNASDPARQSALIIDQTNGGTVTQYAAIDNFSLLNKDYIRYGVDPSTGRAYERIYGDFYAGGRNPELDAYMQFDSSTGLIKFKGTIIQDSYTVDDDGNLSAITVDRGLYDSKVQYYVGNTVSHLGSTYYCFMKPPIGMPPTNTTFWRVWASKGAAGAAGADGSDAISIYCDSQNISVAPTINNFTKSIVIKLLSGGVPVPTLSHTSFDKTLIGLEAGADVWGWDSYTINLTGFVNETTGIGYVNVSIGFNGNTYQLSISVVRLGTPVMINGKDWIAYALYTGNYIQRAVVKYDSNWYAVRPSAGTFYSTQPPEYDTTRWELLNSFTNVATDTLLANEANIAGFIYKNEQMISQSGTIAGNASTNWAHVDFVPNLTLDGSTGQIDANKAKIRGDLEAASGNFKALSNGTFEIDFESVVEGGKRRMEIKSSTGEIVSSLVGIDDSYSSFSTDGIFVNRAAINPLPSFAGINAASGISALGNASVSGLNDPAAFVCGVYGVAANTATDPAPAYGGYFEKLFAKGLYLSTRRITNTTSLSSVDTFISCANTSAITIYMYGAPYIGMTVYIKKLTASQITIDGSGNNLFTHISSMTYATSTKGQMISLTFDGSHWCTDIY